jgi:hypothetical protein
MHLKKLNPKQYKRFFAFGCSYTNYYWPTWADIIGQDVDFYENWGSIGSGNHYIFNSIIEAHVRHNFTKDDLVMIGWTSKEREDRYVNNKWASTTSRRFEEVYGRDWLKNFGFDQRSFLIRDFAYIKATHALLKSLDCDWCSMCMLPIFSPDIIKIPFIKDRLLSKEEKLNKWIKILDDIYQGGPVPKFIDNYDVVELYQSVLSDIDVNYESIMHKTKYIHKAPNDDLHPTPLEALTFLDSAWPTNNISDEARNYAKNWNSKIFELPKINSPVHNPKSINRL